MKHILSITIRWIAIMTLIFPASPVFADAISAHSGDDLHKNGPQVAIVGTPLSQRVSDDLQAVLPPSLLRQKTLPAPAVHHVSRAAEVMSLPGNLTLSLPPALKNTNSAADQSLASVQTPEQAATRPLPLSVLFARGASAGPDPADSNAPTAELATITDEQGNYVFEQLEKATHKITLDTSTLPADLQLVANEAPPVLWLNPGQEMTSESSSTGVRFTAAYNRETGSIGGVVFFDVNGDGVQEAGEPGLSGVRVIDPGMHQYFVPFNDVHLWELFAGKQGCHGAGIPAGQPLISDIFIIASSDNTRYYYDHWEDGYDSDPFVPGATTEVSILDAGLPHIFHSEIYTANLGNAPYYYDGRDRITIFGEAASVVRVAHPQAPGALLAAAWEAPEVADWGEKYVATVGKDLDYQGIQSDHASAGMSVMAVQTGTQVYFNGVLTATLGSGEAFFVNGAPGTSGVGGGINSNDMITTTAPVQIQLMTGSCSSGTNDYPASLRGYTLQPVGNWSTAYIAPVPGFENNAAYCAIDNTANNPNPDTDVYIHNPHASPINVTVQSGVSTTIITVAPYSTTSVLRTSGWADLAEGYTSTHFFSTETFWGVVVVDSTTENGSLGTDFDWGYSLIAVDNLSSQVVVGFGQGRNSTPPATPNNGNLAFVTAVTDTVVYVDLNQDGLPDPVDLNGDDAINTIAVFGVPGWNEPLSALGIPLQRGQSLRIGDPVDYDMMGALIYTADLSQKIAVSWGQDPCAAQASNPYLDLGYTVLPVPIPSMTKVDELAQDADTSGDVSPGDVMSYTIVLFNNGMGPLLNARLTDTLPYTYSSFVPGSMHITTPPITSGVTYYDGSNWTTTPATNTQLFTITWPSIDAQQTVTITFQITLNAAIPNTVTQITNQAIINADNIDPTSSEDPEDPTDPDTDTPIGFPALTMTKVVTPGTARPGEAFTYTLVVSNGGNGLATDLRLSDTLPPYLYYISNTLNITWPVAYVITTTQSFSHVSRFDGFYADDFDPLRVYTGNDGSLDWSGPWTEIGEADGPTGGNIGVETDSLNAATPPNYLQFTGGSGNNMALLRAMDLSQFISPTLRYYISGTVNADGDDYYQAATDGDGVLIQEEYNGSYTLREYPISPAATTLIFTATAGLDSGEVYRFDNIAIYDANTEPTTTTTQIVTWQTALTYVNAHGINPLSYNRATGAMVITDGARLPAGGLITVTFRVTAAIPLTNNLVLTNAAVVSASNIPAPITATAPVNIVSRHALTITKSDTPDPVAPNSLLTYTLHYTVAGDDPAPNVVITDATPAGTTFVSAAGGLSITAPPVGGTGVVSWYLGDLLPVASGITLQTGVVTMVVRVNPGMSGTITNTAFITDDTGLTDSDVETTTILLQPALAITKTRITPSPVPVGAPVQFQIVVANVGNTHLVTVPLTDTYDITYLRYISAAPPSDDNNNDGVINWAQVGPLNVGAQVTVTVNFTAVASTQGVSTTNTATASATDENGFDALPVSDDDTVQITGPALGIAKRRVTPSPVPVGEPVQFVIVVSNTGDTRLVTVPLTDTYDTTYLSYTGAAPPSDDNTDDGVINWAQVGPLNVGAQAVITVNFTAVATTNLTTNTATASAVDEFGTGVPDVSDDATVVVTTVLSPGIQLEKTVYPGHNNGASCPGSQVITGTHGADITYCFVVTNTGSTWLQPITITDALLNIPPNTVTMLSGVLPLAPGASAIYYFESTLTQGLINTAHVEGNPTDSSGVDIPGLPNPIDDDDAEVRLVGPGIVINKSINADRGVRGQVVTYTLRVTNTGTISLNPVRITDTLPPAMTYKNATPQPDPPATGPVLVWSDLTGGSDFLPGESLTVTLAITISTSITGTYTNVATVTGDYTGGSITDTGGVPIGVVDPSVELNKEIMSPGMVNGVITYAIRITNTGPSTLDVIPVYDVFTGPIDYIGGWPEPNETHNTATQNSSGSIIWYDLTGTAPNGFGINLPPNQSFLITTVFRLNIPLTSTYQITNTAVTSGSVDDQGNGANEDDAATAVDLLYFEAQKQSDGILLSWATAMEFDNYGFRLLRSVTNNQDDAVSIAFVPAQGQGSTGGAYSYLDTDVRRDKTYFYWLVDIDLNDVETWHGPKRVYYTPFFNLYLPLVIKD